MKEKLKTYIGITRLTIFICWISLLAFWVIKLFFGNLFEIAVQDKNFIEATNVIQNTWVKYLVSLITIAVAKYLTFGAICQKFTFKGKQLGFVIFSILSIWAVSNFMPLGELKFPAWYAYLVFVIISVIYQKGWKKIFGVLAIGFETVFSIISAVVRNLPIDIMSNYLITMIFIFDLYLMLALYYLYSNLLRLKGEIEK